MRYLIVAISLLIMGYFYLLNQNRDATVSTSKVDKQNITDLKKDIQSLMLKLLSTLEGINDIKSAKESVAILDDITHRLKEDEPKIYDISTIDRMQIKQYVTDFIPHLTKPLKKISKIDGATSIIDSSIKKLEDVLILYKKF